MSYEDIVEAQKKRDMTVARKGPTRKKRARAGDKLLTKSEEKRKAEQEIQPWNMSDYCWKKSAFCSEYSTETGEEREGRSARTDVPAFISLGLL
jgi:hypothetical protein